MTGADGRAAVAGRRARHASIAPAISSVALLGLAAMAGIPAAGAAGSAPPVGTPSAGAAPGEATPPVVTPTTWTLKLKMGIKTRVFVYLSPTPPRPGGHAVVFFSSSWGWRPLHQETAAHIAGAGHTLIGIDSTAYFDRKLDDADWARDLAALREFANARAGLPPETPVLMLGHAWGADLITYVAHHGGVRNVAGAILVGPSDESAFIYRVSLQMKNIPSPADERFDVVPELRGLGTMPLVFIEGALDQQSRARALSEQARGPHKFMSIPGGDKQFDEIRDTFFLFLDRSLAWLESPQGEMLAPPAASGGTR
jgi:hypothetical protein